jgi:hypothetical protein
MHERVYILQPPDCHPVAAFSFDGISMQGFRASDAELFCNAGYKNAWR